MLISCIYQQNNFLFNLENYGLNFLKLFKIAQKIVESFAQIGDNKLRNVEAFIKLVKITNNKQWKISR